MGVLPSGLVWAGAVSRSSVCRLFAIFWTQLHLGYQDRVAWRSAFLTVDSLKIANHIFAKSTSANFFHSLSWAQHHLLLYTNDAVSAIAEFSVIVGCCQVDTLGGDLFGFLTLGNHFLLLCLVRLNLCLIFSLG